METFNEATVLALMESARKEKRFAHCAIVQKGTNVMIDGFHRTEAVSRLLADGLEVYLGIEEYETDDPAGLAADINKTRRTWTTEEERRTQVQFLANYVDEDGDGFTNQQIADATGSSERTVRRDKAKTLPSASAEKSDTKPKVSKGKDGKRYVPPATPEQIAKAWEMKGAGMSTQAIAQDLGFGASTVRKWFTKERPEAVQQCQPPTPQEPTPSVPSAGSLIPKSKADDPVLEGWNGNFNKLAEKIYKREKPSSKKRVAMIEQLAEFRLELEKTMKAASNNHREKAGRLLEVDVRIVEAVLEKEGRPGIEETLKGVMHEAERIQKHASELLRILQLDRKEA